MKPKHTESHYVAKLRAKNAKEPHFEGDPCKRHPENSKYLSINGWCVVCYANYITAQKNTSSRSYEPVPEPVWIGQSLRFQI